MLWLTHAYLLCSCSVLHVKYMWNLSIFHEVLTRIRREHRCGHQAYNANLSGSVCKSVVCVWISLVLLYIADKYIAIFHSNQYPTNKTLFFL